MREIEVKFRVKDAKALEGKLRAQGCVLGAPIRQHDTIYTKSGDAALFTRIQKGDVAVRIRREDSGATFNLKRERGSESELDSDEYETDVSDPDAVHQILLLIGFKPEVEVKKVRRKGKLGGDEICLDEVEELGSYIELERLTNDDVDYTTVANELYAKLESLGLSRADEEKRGYDTQLYQLHHERAV